MNRALKSIKRESRRILADGYILECGNEGFKVETDQGVLGAKRAVSCLVEPIPGDRVLVAGDIEDLFVLAVLQRQDASAVRITVEGDLSLGVPNGRFTLAASEGVGLVSAKDMELSASELTVRAPRANVLFEGLTYLGQKIFARTEAIRLVGGFLDTVLERVSQKVKRSYRVVEEIDQVRSDQIDYRAEKNMSLRGQNALVTASELVKLDGEQIHLG